MRDLATCYLAVMLDVGGCSHRVEPATARTALTLYASLRAYAGGEEEAWSVVESSCRAWLPRRLADRYFSRLSLKAATVEDLGKLLRVGILDEKRHDADLKKVEEEVRERSWFAVLADFSNALSVSPQEALSLPWPLFVGLAAEVVRLQARRSTDVLLGYAAARTGGTFSIGSFVRRG